jgi:hypothetical protein
MNEIACSWRVWTTRNRSSVTAVAKASNRPSSWITDRANMVSMPDRAGR